MLSVCLSQSRWSSAPKLKTACDWSYTEGASTESWLLAFNFLWQRFHSSTNTEALHLIYQLTLTRARPSNKM